MNLENSIKNYLEQIESSSPTPGGGNVSAFTAAMACSLGIMVCNLTAGKKKYADVEGEILELKNILTEQREEFLLLAQKDNEAFNEVMNAIKLPKSTDKEISFRKSEIDRATVGAAMIPAKVIVLIRSALSVLEKIARKGNQNSVSDAGVAISLLNSAAQGAFLNVLINYTSMNDKSILTDTFNSSENLLKEINSICSNNLNSITNNLKK